MEEWGGWPSDSSEFNMHDEVIRLMHLDECGTYLRGKAAALEISIGNTRLLTPSEKRVCLITALTVLISTDDALPSRVRSTVKKRWLHRSLSLQRFVKELIVQSAMPGQRVAFDIAKKKEAIAWIRDHGGGVPSRAESHFRVKKCRVTAATLRKWRRNRDAIEETPGHRKRLDGAGRKPLLVHVEAILFDLVIERHTSKEKVTREWIAETAMALLDETGNGTRFLASDNWVTRFMARHDLSMRRRTNLTTLTDDVLTDRAVAYMAFLEEHKPDMDPARVVMMDETAVFFEDPRLHTVYGDLFRTKWLLRDVEQEQVDEAYDDDGSMALDELEME